MRASLARWIADADALRHLEYFGLDQPSLNLEHVKTRADDYYLSLVGELYDNLRAPEWNPGDWARLGNAFWQFCTSGTGLRPERIGVSRTEAALFASCAFFFGGFPASAYLVQRDIPLSEGALERELRCIDLLRRSAPLRSETATLLAEALRNGNFDTITATLETARAETIAALNSGPAEWVLAALFEKLVERFAITNIRAILPQGGDQLWTPLVSSFLDRRPPTWDYFPSQIQAINAGLLQREDTFSLQMPTGAGKTTLCETLLYWHAKTTVGSASILLVPYRSLASELRSTLVKRLNDLGISAKCAYGGTVPTGDEIQDIDTLRVLVATPEALSGTLSAEPGFFQRISLVICDEGHLLDSGDRGVGLELLLARMRARPGPPRLVFVSAIVPNIEEINAWLGGPADSVVRSDYRPASAEFAAIRPYPPDSPTQIDLVMHPHLAPPQRFSIAPFLKREDFKWLKPETGKLNTLPFRSVKTQAIATAWKALPMGAVAVFAAHKRGDQGAIGLAEELIKQINLGIALPDPRTFANAEFVGLATEYLSAEYGDEWTGTQALRSGAVLHHGDIPQETREVLEALLRTEKVRMAICTSTLAEGVNLPIRTLVLYSVQRRHGLGGYENLLARDIKNLAGRAGRPGATTKGLVICANPQQWPIVAPVANQGAGEPVTGELRRLVERVRDALAVQNVVLTNADLEDTPALHSLVDGIDATLIDLAAEEIGEDELIALATAIADRTFASRQAQLESSRALLRNIFELRARRIFAARAAQRLDWIRDTGARVRLLESAEALMGRRERWDNITNPVDPSFVDVLLGWAWEQNEMEAAIRESFELDGATTEGARQPFFILVASWLAGQRYSAMAHSSGIPLDRCLGIHARAVTFVLQTLVEQAVALLGKALESQGLALSPAVTLFPEHLRFGVPSSGARILASRGVRHRLAAVELGHTINMPEPFSLNNIDVVAIVRQMITDGREGWEPRLGRLVYANTVQDLSAL